MNQQFLNNSIRWLFLLSFDIFVVSRLDISVYALPHIYILFILLLPVRVNRSALLLMSFLTGLVMDIFLNSHGLHAAASTLIAFLRPFILPLFTSPEDRENNVTPNMKALGQGSFIFYASLLVFSHHLLFFSLEIFKPSAFFLILLKTLISGVLSVALIALIQVMFTRPQKLNEQARR